MSPLLSNTTVSRIKGANSFDAIKYVFAFLLIAFHFTVATGMEKPWFVPNGEKVVMTFFVIAGFLVVYGFIRNSDLGRYVRKRCLRILPSYVLVVATSFLLLSALSNLPFRDYFSDPQSWRYLVWNLLMLNFLEPDLPGVFASNPEHCVNGSLWFVKVIVMFYVAVPFIVWLLRRIPKIWVVTAIYGLSVAYIIVFDHLYESTGNPIYWSLQHQLGGNMVYLFSGTIILLYFDAFSRHIRWLFPLALAVFIAYDVFGLSVLRHAAPLAFAVMIIGLAFFCKPLFALKGRINITYELFLFHFPIIQVVVHFRIHEQSLLLAFVLSLAATIGVSLLAHRALKPLGEMG